MKIIYKIHDIIYFVQVTFSLETTDAIKTPSQELRNSGTSAETSGTGRKLSELSWSFRDNRQLRHTTM